MRTFVAGLLVGAAALLLPGGAAAQVYDVPSFNTPYGEDGWGLYLIFPNEVDDVGGEVTWRRSTASLDYGFRGAIISAGPGDDVGLMGGLDLKDQFVEADEQFPLDVAWVTGIGFGFVPDADVGVLRIPGGVSLGRALQAEGEDVAFTPYVYPRLALDVLFFETGPDDDSDTETDLHFDVDLGLDIDFGERWKARFGATLGENEAIGLGLAF